MTLIPEDAMEAHDESPPVDNDHIAEGSERFAGPLTGDHKDIAGMNVESISLAAPFAYDGPDTAGHTAEVVQEGATAQHAESPTGSGDATNRTVYYGPHECDGCGKPIVRVALEQGGQKFDLPDGPIYPNSDWPVHECSHSGVKPFVAIPGPSFATGQRIVPIDERLTIALGVGGTVDITPDGFRVKVGGFARFGHGATLSEALDDLSHPVRG